MSLLIFLEVISILFEVIAEKVISEQVQNHHEGHIVPRVMVNHYGFSITNSETFTFLHPHLPGIFSTLFVFLNVTFLAYLVTETQLKILRSKQHKLIGSIAQLLGYIVQFL